uniref:WD_REPEATS_REGION domain-containing protein n=1 Tax=Steinernema glaseri TaxID=37863 RepID=A0A1I8A2T3_9BILA
MVPGGRYASLVRSGLILSTGSLDDAKVWVSPAAAVIDDELCGHTHSGQKETNLDFGVQKEEFNSFFLQFLPIAVVKLFMCPCMSKTVVSHLPAVFD